MTTQAPSKSTHQVQQLQYDAIIHEIADYVVNKTIDSSESYDAIRVCLLDSLGCALLALQHKGCCDILGPIMPGQQVEKGTPIPGTNYCLDPVNAAFSLGVMIRYLDYNDTWLAAEYAHPSDNFAAIIALAVYLAQQGKRITFSDVLTAAIKAYEIQGVLALENSFNGVGLDHVAFVKIASAAVCTHLWGGSEEQVRAVISQAFVDGQPLRTYRHAPNTGPRKSWAAADASSRALHLSWLVLQGQRGIPTVLSAELWGFETVCMHDKKITLAQPLGHYVVDNILFKIRYPAEFHAQTAVECALQLHPQIKDRLADIEKVVLTTQKPAIKIISKTGPLNNFADRDHCLQYMVAIGLLHGELKAEHYLDKCAANPEIDLLRDKMHVEHDPAMTGDYYAADKRAIPNAIQIFFNDGSSTEKVQIDYPIGHRCHRQKAMPILFDKFKSNVEKSLSDDETQGFIAQITKKIPLDAHFSEFWNDFCKKVVVF